MLPFTLVDALGWVMIPVVSLTAFLVLCIEQLAVQIENPFGYDANDLPLHSFTCCVEAGPLRQLTVAHLLAAPQPGSPASFRRTRRSWAAPCTHAQSLSRSDLPGALWCHHTSAPDKGLTVFAPTVNTPRRTSSAC